MDRRLKTLRVFINLCVHSNHRMSVTLSPGAVSWIGDVIISLSVTFSVDVVSTIGGVVVSDDCLSRMDEFGSRLEEMVIIVVFPFTAD